MFEVINNDSKTQTSSILFSGTYEECVQKKAEYEMSGCFPPEQTLEIKEVS